ncbi:MAG TPA: DUF1707 domain-containing protein [Pseudonocardiaceae bacterium]|nr:DUF1707 domain-containing protein [Pseudonocardiaceae bacterium]
MTAQPVVPEPGDGVRASNSEREAFAETVAEASRDGRLTVTEADERLTRIYAATFREELPGIVADLPKDSWPIDYGRPQPAPAKRGNEWSFALTAHVAFVAVIAVGAVAAWIHSKAPFFWPAFPLFWLGVSVFVHYRIRQRWLGNWRGGRRGNPADATMPAYRGPWSSNRAA